MTEWQVAGGPSSSKLWRAGRWRVAIVLLLLPCSGCDLRERTTGLFATRDQQAQRQFDRGEYIKAAELFTDPVRQGVAWYRAGQFDKAAGAFGRSGTVEGLFNRGNALVLMGNYEGAIAGYLGVLKERPGWEPAERNIEIAGARLEKLKPPDDQPSQKGVGEDDEPDDIVFDDRAKNQESANEETVQGAGEELTDEALRALWLRRVENSPAEFLKRKFAYQHARREEGEP